MSGGQQTDGSIVDELPLKEGALFGAVAYVVGYALTYVLLTVDGEVEPSELGSFLTVDLASGYQVVGWFFYGAHFVSTELTGSGNAGSATIGGNVLSETTTQIPSVVYYAVPIVLLVAAGYALVTYLDLGDVSTEAAAKSGSALAVGYLPLAIVGTIVFSGSVSQGGQSISMGPDLVTGALLAGIVFPLVLGAAGGALASET